MGLLTRISACLCPVAGGTFSVKNELLVAVKFNTDMYPLPCPAALHLLSVTTQTVSTPNMGIS